MLVKELRDLLKHYKEDDLRLLIVEMYKSMPKKLKEEKGIDALLENPRVPKSQRSKREPVDVESLIWEAETFVEYAYKQYYLAPNSYVHKKERPKWRFKARALINNLLSVPAEGPEGQAVTVQLERIYTMLCYACSYHLFSTDNPFRSAGFVQMELLDQIIARKLVAGVHRESVKSSIALTIKNSVDRETLHSWLIKVLIRNLKTPDAKKMAIEECEVLRGELEKEKPPKSSWSRSSFKYAQKRKLNDLTETVFRIRIGFGEHEKAIRYYHDHYKESSEEIALYILLSLLKEVDLVEHWLDQYEKALALGIDPRKELKEKYLMLSREKNF